MILGSEKDSEQDRRQPREHPPRLHQKRVIEVRAQALEIGPDTPELPLHLVAQFGHVSSQRFHIVQKVDEIRCGFCAK